MGDLIFKLKNGDGISPPIETGGVPSVKNREKQDRKNQLHTKI
jgi:hypothetical protein